MGPSILRLRKWKNNESIKEILSVLVKYVRTAAGRNESSILGIINSRNVKTPYHVKKDCGIDGNKKIKGRKDYIVSYVLGLPLKMMIHAANIFDGVAVK